METSWVDRWFPAPGGAQTGEVRLLNADSLARPRIAVR
jgi:hypothetical protein